ncbi:hypothetical protein EVAR_44568_1 [Eumeta japonica]|uniref:Uncharacterized protein n=1 Tax=Eumeta variegata TaxID=151549 RepID=A0A4C1XAE2_EUMVA|nr:hypothetical protein EVAR_44568_1 [Eumeta japonica]
MRRLHSERRLGRISYPHASHKLPRRSSPAQANLRSSFHSYRGPTCVDDVPVSDDRLVGALIDVWPARQWTCTESGCAIELRWERPSPGVPTVRPLSVHAYRRDKAIRRRDRTRQPVTTPQLVTPLESVKQYGTEVVASCLVSRRGHDPDGSGGNGPLLIHCLTSCRSPVADPHAGARGHCAGAGGEGARRYPRVGRQQPRQYVSASRVLQPPSFCLVSCDVIPVRRTTRGARHRACAQRRVGGCEEVVSEGGRRGTGRTRSRPPVVGRWWTPTGSRRHASVTRVGVDLTERARRPLIRLSTHPTAAARAVRVSGPRPSSLSSFFDVFFFFFIFNLQSGAYAGHPRASLRMRSAAGRGTGCGVRLTRAGTAQPRVSEPVSSSRPALVCRLPIDDRSIGSHQSNCSHDVRVGAPPSAACFGAVMLSRDLNKLRVVAKYGRSGARREGRTARVFGSTRAQDGLRWSPGVGRDLDGLRRRCLRCDLYRTRGRRDGPGELVSEPAAPRRDVRSGPLPGVNCPALAPLAPETPISGRAVTTAAF